MNQSLYLNPLLLLHKAQAEAVRLSAETARHAAKGVSKLLCQYRDAFNRHAAGSPESRYSEDLSVKL